MNVPSAGFYRIKGYAGKYITATASNNAAGISNATDASTIVYINDSKNFIFYSNGGYGLYNTCTVAPVDGTLNTYTFSKGKGTGFNITSDAAENNYLYDNGSALTGSASAVTTNPFNTDWYVEEVTSLPFTFNTNALGYATYNCPVDVQVPDGVKAYVCKRDGTQLTLSRIEDIKDNENKITIPANTAVLLYNADYSTNANVQFNITDLNEEQEVDNDFDGTVAASTLDDGYAWYSLQKVTSGTNVGKMCFLSKASGNLGGFKAWIRTENTNSARQLTIVYDGEDDPTGIVEALGLEDDNVEIYDMSGRKLSSYKNGINIVNGKKIMVQ